MAGTNNVVYTKTCKVCNSFFRNRIEELSMKGLSAEKVFNYLTSLQDVTEQEILKRENITPSAIRRHIQRHFQKDERMQLKITETNARIEKSREMLKTGTQITIDKVNSLCNMIDVALVKMEQIDLDSTVNSKDRYTLIANYMKTTKDLIESLAKLTGELKQEGTIDINFFTSEISTFANIVLEAIRQTDKQLNQNGDIETIFASNFKAQWDNYKQRQTAILNGEMKPQKIMPVNTFNQVT